MRFTALSALAVVSTSILALPITPSGNSIILGDNTINRRNADDDKTNTAELLSTPVVSRFRPREVEAMLGGGSGGSSRGGGSSSSSSSFGSSSSSSSSGGGGGGSSGGRSGSSSGGGSGSHPGDSHPGDSHPGDGHTVVGHPAEHDTVDGHPVGGKPSSGKTGSAGGMSASQDNSGSHSFYDGKKLFSGIKVPHWLKGIFKGFTSRSNIPAVDIHGNPGVEEPVV